MLGVDVGGTFTDVVGVRDGRIEVTKVPSNRAEPQRSVIEGARRLGVEGRTVFNHASTMGLNAVITRRLPKIGFLTTEGHRDMLDGGRAWRPLHRAMDPGWRRSFGDAKAPLIPRYLRRGISERILSDGEQLIALDEDQARQQLEVLSNCGVEGVAVCLLNAYVSDRHEVQLRELIREVLGDVPISISSETSPLAKEYTRASTTVIDVMMKLIFTSYAEELDKGLTGLGFEGDLNFADCAATLLPWKDALHRPYRIVFAGPAAGTVSSTRLGEAMGDGNLLCADVGGTSTDISIVMDGEPFLNDTFELEHDLVINALSTEISSVGAGGGSLVAVSTAGEVTVGPGSAGAEPGPACYGRGGTLPTVTDACMLMGILDAEGFAGGEMNLDPAASEAAFESLDTSLSLGERVAFAYRIAVSNIAEEITNVAIRHGVDIRDFSIMSYGAAGPMLLPATLEILGARRVIVPPHPGLFSALGLLSTDLVYTDSCTDYMALAPANAARIDSIYRELEDGLRRTVGDREGILVRRTLDGRLTGQSWETPFTELPPGPITAETMPMVVDRFHAEYESRFGQRFAHLPVEAVTYRVQLVVPIEKVEFGGDTNMPGGTATPSRRLKLRHVAEEEQEIYEYRREEIPLGSRIDGPAVIREDLSTTFVYLGQTAAIGSYGEIIIEQATAVGA